MPNRKLVVLLTLVMLVIGLSWSVTSAVADATKTKTLISGQGAQGARDGANHFSIDGGATFAPAFILPNSVPGRPVNIPSTWAAPVGNSKWINFSRSAVSLSGASDASPQTTTYRTHFSLPARFDAPSLSVTLLADNFVEVFLNGFSVGDHIGFGASVTLDDNDVTHFQKGRNVLEFDVTDTGGAAGFDYEATITYAVKGRGR